MKSCFTVSDNIIKSLMGTTNSLWANFTEKRMGVLFDWLNARISFDHSLSNLQRYVAGPSRFLVLWSSSLFFFSSVFPSPSFFTFFSFLILFGGGTYVTSAFFSVLLLDGILAKKFVMSHFLRNGWVSFGFTRMSRSKIKRTKWFGCQSFSKSVSVVCDHNIDPVFSVFTRGEIVTFKSFHLTKGFFDSG